MLLTLFGHRVNRNGEKMVSVVHVDKYTVNGKVDEHKDILVRQSDGQFERCFYFNGKKSGIHKYEYETNEYGLIKTKIDEYKLNDMSIENLDINYLYLR